MTFLLNQGSSRKLKRVVPDAPKHNSFLTFILTERNQVTQTHQRYLELLQEKEAVSTKTGATLSEQLSVKKRKLDLEKQTSDVPLTTKEFDSAVLPFLDLYYTKDRNKDITEESMIQLYRQEFFAASNAPQFHVINTDDCAHCGTEYVFSGEDALLYCPQCGSTSQFMDATSSSIAYGDEIEYSSFSYKRINHLNEWLNHFQAKETTPVPEEVLQQIMTYLYEKRCTKPEQITFAHIKKAQKQLGLRKYYDQGMQIWCRLTGQKPLRLDPMCEEKIRLMFIRIQKPFDQYCPKNRKNFLSYPYCMYKFCQLLGRQDLLPFFSLLKGKDKLQVQEEIFVKICQDLEWQFIPI